MAAKKKREQDREQNQDTTAPTPKRKQKNAKEIIPKMKRRFAGESKETKEKMHKNEGKSEEKKSENHRQMQSVQTAHETPGTHKMITSQAWSKALKLGPEHSSSRVGAMLRTGPQSPILGE
ncbi:hypothetical protein PIB30_093804 [Stylosanthes scabra]|uniref:Uncharacterized protein n=1 Tax=Stylosanthes scabra TaxID=79078 RepID=A0ABU6TXN0_9FABA|nr:hypothetical protein [Stylosanthes scabra]